VSLRHNQDGGDQPFDHARTWGDDLAPAQFVHQRRGDSDSVRGQRYGQQPSQPLTAMAVRVHLEAEGLPQPVKLLAPCLGPGRVPPEHGYLMIEALVTNLSAEAAAGRLGVRVMA
jgi:hypothetical protein